MPMALSFQELVVLGRQALEAFLTQDARAIVTRETARARRGTLIIAASPIVGSNRPLALVHQAPAAPKNQGAIMIDTWIAELPHMR